jgi:hypothetical protein
LNGKSPQVSHGPFLDSVGITARYACVLNI